MKANDFRQLRSIYRSLARAHTLVEKVSKDAAQRHGVASHPMKISWVKEHFTAKPRTIVRRLNGVDVELKKLRNQMRGIRTYLPSAYWTGLLGVLDFCEPRIEHALKKYYPTDEQLYELRELSYHFLIGMDLVSTYYRGERGREL